MQSIFNMLINLGPWNWLILAIVLFVLETVLPGVNLIWFGVAATIVGALALSIDIAWQWQLIMFGSIALVSVVFIGQFTRFWSSRDSQQQLNARGSYYIGRIVQIEEAIVGGRGRARVADSLWSVEGPDMPAGAMAKVIDTNGTVLVVATINEA